MKPRVMKSGGKVWFNCPACGKPHGVMVDVWDGNAEYPTFLAAVMVSYPSMITEREEVCYSFVTEGRIQYMSHSTHAMVGQTVDLPEWL